MMDDKLGIQAIESKGYGKGATKVTVHPTWQMGYMALMANSFIERWAMVAAKPDGEDSAGRQRLTLLSVPEVVERACSMAETALAEFEKRGWMLTVPLPRLSDDKELDLDYIEIK